jgi:hypothetical protein
MNETRILIRLLLEIRLSFVKTSEFWGEGEHPPPIGHSRPRIYSNYLTYSLQSACHVHGTAPLLVHFLFSDVRLKMAPRCVRGQPLDSRISAFYHGAAYCHENGGYRFLRSDTKYHTIRRRTPEDSNIDQDTLPNRVAWWKGFKFNYQYATLKNGDTFREMRRQTITSLCERHRVYLHKLR